MERENIIPTLAVFVLIILALVLGANHVSDVERCRAKGGEYISTTFGSKCVKEVK